MFLELLARFLVMSAVVSIFIASQLFWFRRVGELGGKLVRSERWRRSLAGAGVILFLFLFAYNFAWTQLTPEPTEFALKTAVLQAPFRWWMLSSLLGFGLAILLGTAIRLVRVIESGFRRLAARLTTGPAREAVSAPSLPAKNPGPLDPPMPGRRRFLEQAALAVSAAPFFAGAYGLLYGRLNLETARQRIRLRRLPKAFDGLRIAQLSDIHIGPFMPAEEVRRYVDITNELKPDLVVLTGDFITWDPSTQEAVVAALAGLKAPLGVLGCLGNHEMWYEVEDSITRLFAARGMRILRGQNAILESHGERLNVIGVDFQSLRRMGPRNSRAIPRYLLGVERLMLPDTANILLSHNPNTFDRAAELGLDLSLAGHTHGGQVSMEFIHPSLSPGRLITQYVKGWFEKAGSQLYVNSGIGTMFVPIRIGSPPEITVFELVREG